MFVCVFGYFSKWNRNKNIKLKKIFIKLESFIKDFYL